MYNRIKEKFDVQIKIGEIKKKFGYCLSKNYILNLKIHFLLRISCRYVYHFNVHQCTKYSMLYLFNEDETRHW